MHIFWVNDIRKMDTHYEIKSVLTGEVSPFLFFHYIFVSMPLISLFYGFNITENKASSFVL